VSGRALGWHLSVKQEEEEEEKKFVLMGETKL